MIQPCPLLMKINVMCLKKRIKRLQTRKFHFKFAYRFFALCHSWSGSDSVIILNYQHLILKLTAIRTAHKRPLTSESPNPGRASYIRNGRGFVV